MRSIILTVVFAQFIARCLSQTTIIEQSPTAVETCNNTRSIILAVNLVDEECLSKSENKSNSTIDNENIVETTNVEMNAYALCLLKKSSILNKDGEVSVNFDIIKIIKYLYKKTDDLGLAFMIKALKKCRNLNGNDESTTATKIMKCLLENQENVVWCDHKKI